MIPREEGRQRGLRFSDTAALPAPIKGWNTVDSLAAMDPLFAPVLDNWLPRQGFLELRGGTTVWTPGTPPVIDSFFPYYGPAGNKLFGIGGGYILDITVPGSTATIASTVMSSKNWLTQSFSNLAGSWTVGVNGTDPMMLYNGVMFYHPIVTGVASSLFIGVAEYQQRLWFIEGDSLRAWYFAPNAVQGEATVKDLGPVAKRGGSLLAIGSWSLDAGDGPKEYLVFITTQGEAIVYQGIDPADATDFTLVGKYRIPNPIGRKCLINYAGDMLVLTQQGIYPLSKALLASTIDRTQAITYSISPTFAAAAANSGTSHEWGMCLYTEQNLLIVNVPGGDLETGNNVQYAMNTITGAWTRIVGANATTFIDFSGALLFGHKDVGALFQLGVGQLLSGTDDFGTPITCRLHTAYNYLSQNASLKTCKLVRPTFTLTDAATMSLGLSADFASIPASYYSIVNLEFIPDPFAALWDVALWDVGTWAESKGYYLPRWYTIQAVTGATFSLAIEITTSTSQITLTSVDLLYELGVGVI